MGQWLTDSELGFADLLDVHGETVEYSRTRGEVSVVIDWNLKPAELDRYEIQFTERNIVAIEFPKTAIIGLLKAGQFFTDAQGQKFDIKAVTRTDQTFRCICEVSEDDNPERNRGIYNTETGQVKVNEDGNVAIG